MNQKKLLIFILLWISYVSIWADESWKLYDDSEVAIIEITIDPQALEWIYANVWSDSMHNTTVHFSNVHIDETIEDVGFRLRGNTSRLAWKKSFKLSFNTFVPGREFYDVDKINLNGEHNDPSIIRSKLGWDIFQQIREVSSRAAHTTVYINDEYYGLYISVEHIDDEFLNRSFNDPSGNLWKCHYPARLTYLGDDPDLYKLEENGMRVYELKTNTEADDYFQLARLIDVINNTPSENMLDSLEVIVDIPSVLKYMAIDVLTGSWDDYWYGKNNFYIYHEPSVDRFSIIPYDYDNSFGVDWFDIDWTERDIYEFKHPLASRPLADRFIESEQYRDLYSHFLEFYYENVYDLPIWESRIDNLKDQITEPAELDYYRTLDYGFTIPDFHQSYSEDHYENQHIKRGLKEFINLRNSSLLEQLSYFDAEPVLYNLDWFPKNPHPEDTVRVSVSAFSNVGLDEVVIEFFPEEAIEPIIYPMSYQPVADTKLVEDHDLWLGEISPLGIDSYGYFHIKVTDMNGQSHNFPGNENIYLESVEIEIEDVMINEFLAKNDSFNQDEFGEYDDWLELYNYSNEDMNLAGSYLTDNPDNLTKWQIPENTNISAGGFLLFWCDEDQEQGENHTNFKLNAGGEYLALVAFDGVTIFDEITFGEQSSDISFGRFPDGGDTWIFMQPTPIAANVTLSIDGECSAELVLQNYPNPFTTQTSISFNLTTEHTESTELIIYNIKGQKVRTLECFNSFEAKATESLSHIVWNGEDDSGKPVNSGIYFYKLKSNGFESSVRKTVVLR